MMCSLKCELMKAKLGFVLKPWPLARCHQTGGTRIPGTRLNGKKQRVDIAVCKRIMQPAAIMF